MRAARIVYITDEHSSINPGVTTSLNELLLETSRHTDIFPDIKLISTGHDDYVCVPNTVEHIQLSYSAIGKPWRYPANFQKECSDIIKNCDIVHIHGAWMGPQLMAAKMAKKMGVPFVITFHGMLEPWHWHDKGILGYYKKFLYWKLVAYPAFKHADTIHAITPMENGNLQPLFPSSRIKVILNAIDVNQIQLHFSDNVETQKPEQIILFLGRLHPKKGADILIRAFALADLSTRWRLVIAGPEEVPAYAHVLKQLVAEHNVSNKVNFIGAVYGKEKFKWYKRSWVTVVPSLSEVVGMVNLESLACDTPTITTHETGLCDWEEGGGILVHPEVDQLSDALKTVASWTADERLRRGKMGLDFVRKRYSLEIVQQQWVDLYGSLMREK